MRMTLSRGMGMLAGFTGPSLKENENAESGDAQTGNRSQPWIELLRNNVARCIEGQGS